MKDKYAVQIAEHKAKRDEAAVKVSELQEATEEAWEVLKKGGEEAWSSIAKAILDARKMFH